MIILGILLLIVGFIAKIAILWTIGLVLLVLGLVLVALGSMGRAVGRTTPLLLTSRRSAVSRSATRR